METIRQRLEHDLNTTIGRLRHLGGTVAVEELPGPIGINCPSPTRLTRSRPASAGISVAPRGSCSWGA
jgi:hypothetical protein